MLATERAERVASIKQKIRRMGEEYRPGNSSKAGHLYSPLPFADFSDVPSQRQCIVPRFEMMRDDLATFMGTGRLLDVGCHTGFNCFEFAKLGFECVGVDAHELTIEIAKDTAALYSTNTQFHCAEATPELIAQLGRFDVVIFTAVFQWITAAAGFDAAVRMLNCLCDASDVLYFETSMGQEGKAKMPMLPDVGSVEQLLRSTSHPRVELLGALDRNRFLFRTTRLEAKANRVDEGAAAMPTAAAPAEIEGPKLFEEVNRALERCGTRQPDYAKRNRYFFSRVWKDHLDGGRPIAIKAVQAADSQSATMLYREHEFLAKMRSPHVPKLLLQGMLDKFYILVSDWMEGPRLDQMLAAGQMPVGERLEAEMATVEQLLAERGVCHRDLREANLIWAEGRLVMLDFGWSTWAGEAAPFTPPELVETDDRRALERIRKLVAIGG